MTLGIPFNTYITTRTKMDSNIPTTAVILEKDPESIIGLDYIFIEPEDLDIYVNLDTSKIVHDHERIINASNYLVPYYHIFIKKAIQSNYIIAFNLTHAGTRMNDCTDFNHAFKYVKRENIKKMMNEDPPSL
jgi:hypothetical protein